MKKRLLSALILSAIAVFAAGCGQKPGNGNSSAPGCEPDTFTYWTQMPDAIVSQYTSMSEMTMYKEMEKRTNTKITFKHPPSGQAYEQFNLMVASADLPDMIEYYWSTYAGGPEKAIQDKVILRLNDIIDSSAPNFKAQLDENTDYDKQSRTDEGSIFGFPGLNRGSYRTFGGMIIRKDWLDELGLESPETMSDWENALREFKEKKGAAAPFTGLNNMFQIDISPNFNGAFGVGPGFYLKDGKAAFGPMEDGFRDYITLMRKWYDEKLLDNEYTTNNQTAVDAKMTNGESGAMYGYIGGSIGKYMTAMSGKDPNYNLVAVQHPVLNRGGEPKFMEHQNEVTDPYLAITSKASSPEKIAKWIDYLYSEEGNTLKNFGLEGLTYNIVDGKPVYTDLILHNPDGLSIAEAMTRHFRANAPAPGFGQHPDYLSQYYTLPQQTDALTLWAKYGGNAFEVTLPPLSPLIEEADEMANIMSELQTYIPEMIYKFVRGTEPIKNYDKFREQLKSMGVGRAVELRQKALDRYNAR
jgi:putative aldouronate transport system substrate-binding protein